MKGSRPEQAVLSRDTDLSKTEETRAVIEGMVDGPNDHRIDDIGRFFARGFRWMGNTGCGTRHGPKEFRDNRVMAGFPHVMPRLGIAAFRGEGWEAYDRGGKVPSRPGTRG